MLFSILQIIQDTFTKLFEKYERMMKNLSFSILKDHQLAEDAVQEAMLQLSKNMDKIDNVDSNRGKNYIYTVTKNHAISMLRKIKSEKSVQFFEEEALNNIEGELDVNAFCDKYGFSAQVAEMLNCLDEIDRDIIVYKYGAGYTAKEIARLIDKTPDYVYKRLQRALKKLKSSF